MNKAFIAQEQAGEGCHLYGKLLVNKVAGNFHIAPGKSFQQVHVVSSGSQKFSYVPMPIVAILPHLTACFCCSQGNMHVHDLVPFPTKDFDFSHTIHQLTFGEGYPGMKNPLDGITIAQQGPRNPTGRPGMFQYFLRVRSGAPPDCTCCATLEACASFCRRIHSWVCNADWSC